MLGKTLDAEGGERGPCQRLWGTVGAKRYKTVFWGLLAALLPLVGSAAEDHDDNPVAHYLGRDVVNLTREYVLKHQGTAEPFLQGAAIQADAWLLTASEKKPCLYLEFRNAGSNPFTFISFDDLRLAVTNAAAETEVRQNTPPGIDLRLEASFRLSPRFDPGVIIQKTVANAQHEDVLTSASRAKREHGIEFGSLCIDDLGELRTDEILDWDHVFIELENVRVMFVVEPISLFMPVNFTLSSLNGPKELKPAGTYVITKAREYPQRWMERGDREKHPFGDED